MEVRTLPGVIGTLHEDRDYNIACTLFVHSSSNDHSFLLDSIVMTHEAQWPIVLEEFKEESSRPWRQEYQRHLRCD